MKSHKLKFLIFLLSSSCFAGVEYNSNFSSTISSNLISANEPETFQNATVRELELKGWTASAAMASLATTKFSMIPIIVGAIFSAFGKPPQAAILSRVGLAIGGTGLLAFSGIYAANVQIKKAPDKLSLKSQCEELDTPLSWE